MKYQNTVGVTIQATGTLVSGPCEIDALGLTAGADAATAVFRDGGALGAVRWSLGAGIGAGQSISFPRCLRFRTDCHVTVTGTTPNVHAAVVLPTANQDNPS